MIIELSILNMVLFILPILTYFRRKNSSDPMRTESFGLFLLKIIGLIFICELIYSIYGMIRFADYLDYFDYSRSFMLTALSLVLGIRLYIIMSSEMSIQVEQQKLNKLFWFFLSIMGTFFVVSELRNWYVLIHHTGIDYYLEQDIDPIIARTFMMLFVVFVAILVIYLSYVLYKRNNVSKRTFGVILFFPIIVISIAILLEILNVTGVAMLFSGALDEEIVEFTGIGDASAAISQLFFAIISDQYIGITVVFMVIGAIPRAFGGANPNAVFIGNLAVSWLPLIIWLMAFLGTIPIPNSIKATFADFLWFGYLFYLLLLGIIFIIVIVVIQIFTGNR